MGVTAISLARPGRCEWMVGHSCTQLAPELDGDFLMDDTRRARGDPVGNSPGDPHLLANDDGLGSTMPNRVMPDWVACRAIDWIPVSTGMMEGALATKAVHLQRAISETAKQFLARAIFAAARGVTFRAKKRISACTPGLGLSSRPQCRV